MQIACHNPFSVLSNKKIRQEPPKEKAKDTKPAQRKEAPKKAEGKKAETKKEEPPKKDSKVVSLTEATKVDEVQKQLAKEQEKMDKEAKRERAVSDKHDRSGKAHQVRKEGKGVGGWDDTKVDAEIAQEIVAEEVEGEEKKEKKEKDDGKSAEDLAAEAKVREEEAKLREAEEKQMTLEEWQEKLKEKAPPVAAPSLRTVDDSGFKGMISKGKEKGDKKVVIGSEKVKKPAPKKDEKKKEEKEKIQVDVGFRMENPTRQGKGKGEGKGGKGGGKGRGGYQARDEAATPKVDDEQAFPALGATKAADATEAEASA